MNFLSFRPCNRLCTLTLTIGLSGCANLTPLPDGPIAIVLSDMEGRVLIVSETTQAFVEGEIDMAVRVNDRIIVMENSSATLNYMAINDQGNAIGPTCTVIVPADSQMTISGGQDCTEPDLVTNKTQ